MRHERTLVDVLTDRDLQCMLLLVSRPTLAAISTKKVIAVGKLSAVIQ